MNYLQATSIKVQSSNGNLPIAAVCGEDNKYATLILFVINNARIGYIKMYSVYSERQTDCECEKSLAPRSSYRHMQAYKVVAE